MNECTAEEIIEKLEETQEVDENKQEISECDTNAEKLNDDTTEKIYSDDGPLMSEFEIECFDDIVEKRETRTENPDDIEENTSDVDIKTYNYEEHFLQTQNLDKIICDNEESEEGKNLSRETHIEFPIPSHSKKEPFKCDICNKGSKTCECLKVDKGECSVCHEIFYWTSRLVDTVEKPSCCTTCVVPRSENENIQTGKKLFECNICEKTFLTRSGMSRHKRNHTGEKRFECNICYKKFKHNASLNDHLRIHTGEKPFICPVQVCFKSFRYKPQLSRHIKKHTGMDYNCPICGKSFTSQSCFKSHMLDHNEEKPYECEICHIKFSKKETLTNHLKIHNGDTQSTDAIKDSSGESINDLETEDCIDILEEEKKSDNETETQLNEKITSGLNIPNQLNQHNNNHSDKKLYECDICGKTFLTRSGISRHKRNHTGEKRYECEICYKKFTENASLNAHLRIHTGEKPFTCPIQDCSKSYRYKSQLSSHIRKHTGKYYNCSICGESFTNRSCLRNHMLVHTQESPYESEICHRNFPEKETLIEDTQFTGSIEDTSEESINNLEMLKTEDCIDIIEENNLELEVKTKHCLKSKNEVEEFYLKSENIREETCILSDYNADVDNIIKCETLEDDNQTDTHVNEELPSGLNTPNQLNQHNNIHSGKKLYECDICGKTFLTTSGMSRHKRNHTGEKRYECEICYKKFTENASLNAHLRIHTGEKPFTCPIQDCSKLFRYKSHLSSHIRKHTGKHYNCLICGESFTSQSCFKNHMLVVHTHECEICFTKFPEKETLTNHLKIHIGFTGSFEDTSEKSIDDLVMLKTEDCIDIIEENNLELDVKTEHCLKSKNGVEEFCLKSENIREETCNLSDDIADVVNIIKCETDTHVNEEVPSGLNTQNQLNQHNNIHSGKRSSKCKFCGKSFASISNLNKHIRVHTGEKPYECDICHKKFKQRTHLNAHSTIHAGENNSKFYQCSICGITIRSHCNIKRHMRTHTGEKPYECDICHKKFSQKGSLNDHKRIHTGEKPFICSFKNCQKPFRFKRLLVNHIRTHMQIRTGKKLFECGICHKKFTQWRHLNEHIRIHNGENVHTVIKTENIGEEPFILNNDNEEIDNLINCDETFISGDNDNGSKTQLNKDTCYKCLTCNDGFRTPDELNQHSYIHRAKKCKICGKLCTRRNFKRHLRTHTGEKRFECDICHTKFTAKRSLKDHSRIHTGEKPFTCSFQNCLKPFRHKSALVKHIRTIHKEENEHTEVNTNEEIDNIINCESLDNEANNGIEDCHLESENTCLLSDDNADVDNIIKCEILEDESLASRHNDNETDTHLIDEVSSGLNTPNQLNQHSNIHSGKRSSECKFCGNSFSSISSLKRHIRTHTGEKPYECDICHTKFNQKGSLKDHSRIHTGEKPFTCSFQNCLKPFRHKSSLVNHMKNIHRGENEHTEMNTNEEFDDIINCVSLDNKTFISGDNVNGTKTQYTCITCNKDFCTLSQLYQHRNIDTGECSICHKEFCWISKLGDSNEKTSTCTSCKSENLDGIKKNKTEYKLDDFHLENDNIKQETLILSDDNRNIKCETLIDEAFITST